eukprot:3405615-Rhodomonas_salina.2
MERPESCARASASPGLLGQLSAFPARNTVTLSQVACPMQSRSLMPDADAWCAAASWAGMMRLIRSGPRRATRCSSSLPSSTRPTTR